MMNREVHRSAATLDIFVLLVTSQSRSVEWKEHYKRHHPPDTLMIYHQACQALSSRVYILPIDDYIQQSNIGFAYGNNGVVVNISGGLTDIGLTSIIPCMAAHSNLPIFPASTKHLVTTHDKLLCKYLAKKCGLETASTLEECELQLRKSKVIQKPICGGDSIGISVHSEDDILDEIKRGHFIEEFIEGFDATIHMLRNDDFKTYTILEHLVSNEGGEHWFDFDSKNTANRIYEEKDGGDVRNRHSHGITVELKAAIERLLEVCGNPFIVRIDFRQLTKGNVVGIHDCVFLELNVAPTISHANNWLEGIESTFPDDESLKALKMQPIHPAAISLGYLIHNFYVQSLSIAGNN